MKRSAEETYPGITGLVICRVAPRTPIRALEADDYCQMAVRQRDALLQRFVKAAATSARSMIWAGIVEPCRQAVRRRAAIRHLMALDDAQLKDIGLTRGLVPAAVDGSYRRPDPKALMEPLPQTRRGRMSGRRQTGTRTKTGRRSLTEVRETVAAATGTTLRLARGDHVSEVTCHG